MLLSGLHQIHGLSMVSPPINFIIGDLPSSAREDSERRGHVLVFLAIGGLLVQFGGLASITGL